jgi:hypothetical protein
LLLPVTTTIGAGGEYHSDYAYDYCNLQIKSNHHQWRIGHTLDWKAGVQTVQLRDLTANTTGTLMLDNGRFWQLDEDGRARRLDTIDPATLAQIFVQVKTNETITASAQANAGD